MSAYSKTILVIDHDAGMRQLFAGLLKSQCGFLEVLTAGSLQAAMQIISTQNIDIVITGLNLAEIAALHLIEKLAEIFPDKKIIHMSSPARQLIRTTIQHPYLIHFDQSHNLNLLTKRICSELGIDYGGQLLRVSLSSFLQLLEIDGRSCTLRISTKGKLGYLFIHNGELIHAFIEGVAQNEAKEDALQIMSWDDVTIEIDFSEPACSRELSEPLMMLMLESGRLDDEYQSNKEEKRENERYYIPVALDYDISATPCQCFLMDISLQGAYIETEQDIPIDHIITLTLTLPQTKKSYAIKGVVVRKDPKGVGVRFSKMTHGQKKLIQSFITENTRKEPTQESELPAPAEPPDFLKTILEEEIE